MVGTFASSNLTGSSLAIGELQLQALQGLSGGDVAAPIAARVEFMRFGSSNIIENFSGVAANGSVVITSSMRRLLSWQRGTSIPGSVKHEGLLVTNSPVSSRHLQQLSTGEFLGDVTGDRRFNMDDVSRVEQYVTGISGLDDLTSLSDFTRRQLDPSLDYLRSSYDSAVCRPSDSESPCPTIADILYLLRVQGDKYRFMYVETNVADEILTSKPVSPSGALTVQVRFLDHTSTSATSALNVFVELNTVNVNFTQGLVAETTTESVVVSAVHVGDGRYSITATPTSYWTGVVSVLVAFQTQSGSDSTQDASRKHTFFESKSTLLKTTNASLFDPFVSFSAPTASPTSTLTASPTSFPTASPTASPTTSPTISFPTDLLAKARALLRLTSSNTGPGLPAADGSSGTRESSAGATVRFVGFNSQPGDSAEVQLFLDGDHCTGTSLTSLQGYRSGTYFTTGKDRAASISAILRTTTIYFDDSEVSVHYIVRDAVGRSKVLLTSLAVTMSITVSTCSQTVACNIPDATTGVGDCTADGSSLGDCFVSTQDTVGGLVLSLNNGQTTSSTTLSIILARKTIYNSMTAAGMVTTLPMSPRYTGQTITSSAFVHTGGYALSAFSMTYTFNTNLMQFSSFTKDPKFNNPATNVQSGRVTIAVTGIAAGTSISAVTGTRVAVGSAVFTVLTSASSTTFQDALVLYVESLVNANAFGFLSNTGGTVESLMNASSSAGSVQIVDREVRGIYAYLANAELFNTAVISGSSVTTTTTIKAVYNYPRGTSSDVTIPSTPTCTLSADAATVAVVAASGTTCTITTNQLHTTGDSQIMLSISAYSGSFLASDVPLRVWFPVSIALSVDNDALKPISGSQVNANTDSRRYQSTGVRLSASFGGAGLTSMVAVDVSCMATFASSNSNIASVNGATATGLGPGNTTISVTSGRVSQTAQVTVLGSSNEVSVVEFRGVVVTGASWSSGPSSFMGASGEQTFDASVTLLQNFNSEGISGLVFFYAKYSDGTYEEISYSDGLRVATNSAYQGYLTISQSGGLYSATVAQGASTVSGFLLEGTWKNVNASGEELGTTISNGPVPVKLDLPSVTSIAVATNPSPLDGLTLSGDPASILNIAALPTSFTVSVTVTFSDGTTKNMDGDQRLRIVATEGSDLVQVNDQTISGKSGVVVGGSVALQVSFEGYAAAANVSTIKNFNVVTFSSLRLEAAVFGSVVFSASGVELKQVQCTGLFQHATTKLFVVLSNSQEQQLTSGFTISSSDTSVVATVGAELQGRSIGASIIRAQWITPTTPRTSNNVTATVAINSVSVTALTWSNSAVWTSSTFAAVQNATRQMKLRATFSDGSAFSDAIGGAQASRLKPSTYLSFNSSEAAKIAVSAEGIATLKDNHNALVIISSRPTCSSGAVSDLSATGSDSVWANLNPGTADVDLGNPLGNQFLDANPNDIFTVPVRVNAATAALVNFDVSDVFPLLFD